ncbi:MAG: T9SS type A sorting domain-containing protein [Cyclobacteriaceae bacterium]|nr:T9SS type A sorting domain-containing protein [Cyclobacteriaceae bacterium]
MKPKFLLLAMCCSLSTITVGQTITKNGSSIIEATVCPEISISYSLTSIPNSFSGCTRKWVPTNGIVVGADNGLNVSIKWNDTPGAKAKLVCQFSNCGNSNSGTETSPFEELILSVKDQAWGSYGSTINLDYCNRPQVLVTVPRMFVQGTGGVAQPPLTEVSYAWTLPSGWREVDTGNTGFFGSQLNFVSIEPVNCAVPGQVTVYGTLVGAGPFCNSSARSAIATITMNGVSPAVAVLPPVGYSGGRACDSSPVVFTAGVNASLGCLTNYAWSFPSGWSGPTSTTTNTVSLMPNGTTAMAGTISVTVTASCGSSFSGSTTIGFTQPSISAPDIICSAGNFTLLNTASSPSMSWSSSNPTGLFINPTTGAYVPGSGFSGNVTISASACGVAAPSKIAYVGRPIINTGLQYVYIVGQQGALKTNLCTDRDYIARIDPVPGATSYSWTIPSTAFSINYPSTSSSISLLTLLRTGNFTIRCNAVNACGTSNQQQLVVNIQSCSGGGGNRATVNVFPNPSATQLVIESVQDAEANQSLDGQSSTIDFVARLYAPQGELVRVATSSEGKVQFETAELPNGLYVLKVSKAGKLMTSQISIKH